MKEQILEWCKTLAKSQGFYGRILEELENNVGSLNNLVEECEKHSIKDIVDFVMFIEN
jgi:hypothetical protein